VDFSNFSQNTHAKTKTKTPPKKHFRYFAEQTGGAPLETRTYVQEFPLKYGVNPHQAPAALSHIAGSGMPFKVCTCVWLNFPLVMGCSCFGWPAAVQLCYWSGLLLVCGQLLCSCVIGAGCLYFVVVLVTFGDFDCMNTNSRFHSHVSSSVKY
jgi:hypothetical protein